MPRADRPALIGPVVGLVLGRADHGQVLGLDTAQRSAIRVVDVLVRFDRSAEMTGHHYSSRNHQVSPLKSDGWPFTRRGQVAGQTAVLQARGRSHEPVSQLMHDWDPGSMAAHTLSGANPRGGPAARLWRCPTGEARFGRLRAAERLRHQWLRELSGLAISGEAGLQARLAHRRRPPELEELADCILGRDVLAAAAGEPAVTLGHQDALLHGSGCRITSAATTPLGRWSGCTDHSQSLQACRTGHR